MSGIVGNKPRSSDSGPVTKRFPASLDSLYDMLDFIKKHAKMVGFVPMDLSKIELAAEEALVNIISYGYINRLGQIDIICYMTENSQIKITIKDRGIPFNPLNAVKPSISPPGSRSQGGYGVFFILKIMDEVNYKRKSNNNILTMIKYLTSH